ncbi:hypothetical protein CYMTET_6434 [Cymbomonas tetramitiformis]|uniref:FHA domain-containing protein n=1 Tax=Cymbomonas tetramitiformis TaxID=36881 RepID=A0AAE0GXG1_9CHLO|nr:hypothetical protein CYMTET_6434 [Cymbomonas tetramitiformis]
MNISSGVMPVPRGNEDAYSLYFLRNRANGDIIRVKNRSCIVVGRGFKGSHDQKDKYYTVPLACKPVKRILSRQQFSLEIINNTLFITDTNSGNGTYFNDVRLVSEVAVPLEHGDVISVGPQNHYMCVSNFLGEICESNRHLTWTVQKDHSYIPRHLEWDLRSDTSEDAAHHYTPPLTPTADLPEDHPDANEDLSAYLNLNHDDPLILSNPEPQNPLPSPPVLPTPEPQNPPLPPPVLPNPEPQNPPPPPPPDSELLFKNAYREHQIQFIDCPVCWITCMYKPKVLISRQDLSYVSEAEPNKLSFGHSWLFKCKNNHYICRPCGQRRYNEWVDNDMKLNEQDKEIICSQCVGVKNPAVLTTEQRNRFFHIFNIKQHQVDTLKQFERRISLRHEQLAKEDVEQKTAAIYEQRLQAQSAQHMQQLGQVNNGQAIDMEVFREQARKELTGDICINRCPWCNVGASDINGCMAAHCKADDSHGFRRRKDPGCGKYFCGFCFEKCENYDACHAHVKYCQKNFSEDRLLFGGREYFVSIDQHQEHWAKVTAQRILARIRSEPPEPYKDAMMEVFETLYRKDLQ